MNPVLREGNSDRRSATAVKEHGKRYPHKMMREWPEVSKARVAHMTGGDFYGSEQAVTVESEGTAKIEYVSRDGRETLLKDGIPMTAGEIVDCGVMNVRELRDFYADEMQKAKDEGVLISLHVK